MIWHESGDPLAPLINLYLHLNLSVTRIQILLLTNVNWMLDFGVVEDSNPNITHVDVKECTFSLSRFKKFNVKKSNRSKIDGRLRYDTQ